MSLILPKRLHSVTPELSQLSLCSEFDKENSMEFSLNSLLLIHFTTMAMHLLSHGPHVTLVMWHTVTVTGDVTTRDHPSHHLWHCDKVMWYFSTLHLIVVSPIRKEKKKKRNIDNDLVILPSHDTIGKMSSMLNFPKLDRSNHHTWSDNIMFVLQAWLLWLMVNGWQPTPLTPPADPPLDTAFKKSIPSCYKLHSAISPSILWRFSQSQRLWKALEKTFWLIPVMSRGNQYWPRY